MSRAPRPLSGNRPPSHDNRDLLPRSERRSENFSSDNPGGLFSESSRRSRCRKSPLAHLLIILPGNSLFSRTPNTTRRIFHAGQGPPDLRYSRRHRLPPVRHEKLRKLLLQAASCPVDVEDRDHNCALFCNFLNKRELYCQGEYPFTHTRITSGFAASPAEAIMLS